MNIDRNSLWQLLKDNDVVDAELPLDEKLESPWYVRVMLGISGWMAAAFIMGFIGSVFEVVFQEKNLAMVVGLLMIALAYKVLKEKADNDFVHQLTLAMSFAGQALFALGIFTINFLTITSGYSWFVIGLLQLVLAWIMPSSIHRVWSAFAAAMALSLGLAHYGIFFIQVPLILAAVAIIWLNELNWLNRQIILKPIGYGLTLALLYQETRGLFFNSLHSPMSGRYGMEELWIKPWMAELLAGFILLFVVWQLLKRYQPAIPDRVVRVCLAGSLLLVGFSLEATGISVGVVIILLGFANANRLLTSLGIVSLLFYISSYYYLLDSTLLEKSRLLASVGVLLLLASGLLHRGVLTGKGADNA